MTETETARVVLDVCTVKGKTWLARITGIDAKFGMAREFVRRDRDGDNRSRSGMTGTVYYTIGDGVYEGSEPRSSRRGRFYLIVEGGEKREVSQEEALAALPGPPTTEFIAAEYRHWLGNRHAASGHVPSTARYFVAGDIASSDIRGVLREAGTLADVLYRGDDPEAAERVVLSHRGGYELAGAHGHDRLLKHLSSKGDVRLLADLAPEHLREAVRRKTTRTGWVYAALCRWAKNTALLATTRTDTLAVIAILGAELTPTTMGPEAQKLVDDAMETFALVEELLSQGYPAQWAIKTARNMTGVELPEQVVSEMVRRREVPTCTVSA
ncbi:hypothetical protein I3U40_07955 [Mycobacteroides abscessus subsp. abscessus]|uniref:hypothetical protein n=1 Tax=Mycobacteroides abscessus TaxID=36809 RepID=UPI0019CFB5F0|nr:hypothetical protein [Mycobacteroides abscessus]QSM95670.1 hypothetical protein I3U31_07945 [Mycobacteroides abscessus subsp. abscessus]QSN00703.1 hypothetical protein I3U40_07955 [Mycobacteroides abscessus subsp. abscessus]